MRQFLTYGSVRGAVGNDGSYRDYIQRAADRRRCRFFDSPVRGSGRLLHPCKERKT